MRTLLRCIALLLATLSVYAAPAGFVVRVEGSRIVINRGLMDSVKVGDRFVVMRMGRQVAELVVQNVNQQESQATVSQLYSQEPVLAGDALTIGGDVNPVATNTPSKPKSLTPLQLTQTQTQEDYQEMLKSRTQSQEFQQKWSGKTDQNTDAFNTQNGAYMLDSLAFSLWTGGPGWWWNSADLLTRTASQAYWSHNLREHMMRDYMARIQIEVVHWDNELLETYCKMQAAQQGMTSVEELNALRQQMQREKQLDKNDVFQVRMQNVGELNVEMSPFHWHMFLSAPDDKRVVATHYDQVLDRKLAPKQEVTGFITFPRVPNQDGVKVFLEDVYGDRGEFSFSR
ncbi:MAG: hypothetical protein J0I12_31535 [Candidatus Eremiobacteraeota bacterium]|mgnify:CR=1 FL=1|nr:hypothetical protein [Candidatus Eremiobacteraeota bacterium]